MDIALIDSWNESMYVMELSRELSKAGHTVTVLQKNHAHIPDRNFRTVKLGDMSEIQFAEEVHYWLDVNKCHIVESFSEGYPLVIEQMIGGTPTAVRYEGDVLMRGSDWSLSSRSKMWSRHLLEMQTVKNADIALVSNEEAARKMLGLGAAVLNLPMGILFPDEVKEDRGILLIGEERYLASAKKYLDGYELIGEYPSMGGDVDEKFKEASTVVILTERMLSDRDLLIPMSYGCPVVCFSVGNARRKDWPLVWIGEPGIENLQNLPEAIVPTGKTAVVDSVLTFASKYSWEELIPQYLKVYEATISRSLSKGRIRGW